MYKTELHLHTPKISLCCDCPVEVSAERYIAAGYHTVVVTNHFTSAITTREESWEDTVSWFLSGYEAFRDAAAGRLCVLFGLELRFDGHHNDYLVYVPDTDFLRTARDLPSLPRAAGCERIHEAGGMIFAAHPFRNGMTVLDPTVLDGIEILNAHNGHDSRNELAFAFGKRYGLAGIAGTDFHHPWNVPSAGILTPEPIKTEEDLLTVLRSGAYRTFGEVAPRE